MFPRATKAPKPAASPEAPQGNKEDGAPKGPRLSGAKGPRTGRSRGAEGPSTVATTKTNAMAPPGRGRPNQNKVPLRIPLRMAQDPPPQDPPAYHPEKRFCKWPSSGPPNCLWGWAAWSSHPWVVTIHTYINNMYTLYIYINTACVCIYVYMYVGGSK